MIYIILCFIWGLIVGILSDKELGDPVFWILLFFPHLMTAAIDNGW